MGSLYVLLTPTYEICLGLVGLLKNYLPACISLVFPEATIPTYNFCVYKYAQCVLIRVFTLSGFKQGLFMSDLLLSGSLRLLVVVSFELYN